MYDELSRLSAEFRKDIERCERDITKEPSITANNDLALLGARYLASLAELKAYRRALREVEKVVELTLKKEL
ncbi:MAG: hypothetical protein WAN65_13400 [Candidatus Sulfotelmatobacter sp.]